ncbi:MAG: pimelyl-ACP methyl ester esterase BioV [Pseudomonadota bacterium]
MIFYSGFFLKNENVFFQKYLEESAYTVAGFSYGAIKAALHASESTMRIDTLQLFSPAFFQTKKESFKRLQLGAFTKDMELYRDNFFISCFTPRYVEYVELDDKADENQLRELLYFEWTQELMDSIVSKGIRVEVYLGLEDRVIDPVGAREFFIQYATVTSIQTGNHFLQEKNND